MSDLKLPGEDKKKEISPWRVAVWILLIGVGIYLVVTGLVGVVVKG